MFFSHNHDIPSQTKFKNEYVYIISVGSICIILGNNFSSARADK